ncbi:pentatricopeptide repeat-containing protein At4g16390, chloroplastic-like [Cicer arietinum]|uniref:Pentatricopeptide repeat-containing protein At4g16390, chloroplastic-like n=1 Tax=Cicer arietinum TaxID=3827 RepID=A0A1S2XDM8_CICAR|nr:pentatricopeptide repeat-containing protein At4g16390, chloroplastic-like [Cicer arietinum]XP_027186855.1 pentatricopeptide repeat-containing protein At4g16390, chloroplastic-like [Cicer arietinum]
MTSLLSSSLSNTNPLFLSFSISSSLSCNRNFKFKTFSHLNQESHSHHPPTNSSSLSKTKIWVNPYTPKPKLHRNKPSNSNNSFLLKLAESLDLCDPTQQQVYAILNGFGNDGVSERDAVFILNKMTNPKTAPIVLNYLRDKVQHVRENGMVLYNVTLKVCRKCKDFEGAQKVFDEMLQRGIKPNNITFTTMINCARMAALPDKAVEWFEKMPGFGCEPDAITCSAMVCAFARTNHVDMAQRLYDRAKMEKWPIDVVTFSALIKMYDLSGNYDGCLNIHLEMKGLGVKPNVETYNTLLVAMLRAKRHWQAKTIYQEMKSNGVSPDFTTYSTLLRIFTRAQFGQDALGVYKEMKEKGMNVSIDLYNVLLAMCADVGCHEEALEIYEDMKSLGTCRPDSWTFSVLINVYSGSGKVSEAEGMLDEMIKSGFEPTIFVMVSLVQCYGKAKRIDDVVKVFNHFLNLGIVPDDRFCGCLLNVMTQTPKEELGKLVDCVEKVNTKLGSVVRYLVEVEEQEGDGDFRKEASKLLSSIIAEAKRPICNCLIDLCVNLNLPDRAHDLLGIGLTHEIYRNIQSRSQTKWSLHLKNLSVGAATTALHVWIKDLSNSLESGEEFPPLLGINTGRGKHKHSCKGLASVFKSHLKELNAPFREDPNKDGWFLVTKEAAKSWLESRGSTKSIAPLDSLVLNAPSMALPY